MHPSKAPGPDGVSPFFFQKYWDLVGGKVSQAVISFLTQKEMPHDLNYTHVALIPKVKEVQDMSQLRPIALCNVIYKIASKWQGLRICDEAPSISHLLFADDSMLYFLASTQNCEMIKDLLSLYERASGQQVNLQNSYVVFSRNVLEATSQELANILGVQLVEKHEKYLGIPTLVGRSKSGTFAYLKDNLSKKLTGWRSKLLSAAGRELLIKVVA
ncbi:hypothetical protein ACLB2K_059619 [Fragaria x ananassa]